MCQDKAKSIHVGCNLRWLETVSSTFQDLQFDGSLSADAKIMVSTNCPIIGEQVAVNCVAY